MRKALLGFVLLVLTGGCSDQSVRVHDLPAKPVPIRSGYTVLFCECMDNPLQQELIQQLQAKGVSVRGVPRFADFNQETPGRYYVLFGLNRKVNGRPRSYAVTRLEDRSESGSCGERCNWSRSWNELVRTTEQTEGTATHASVLLYRIDEGTELVLALSAGERYALRLQAKGETGAGTSTVEEKRAYEITR